MGGCLEDAGQQKDRKLGEGSRVRPKNLSFRRERGLRRGKEQDEGGSPVELWLFAFQRRAAEPFSCRSWYRRGVGKKN